MLEAFFGNVALMIVLTGALVGCASALVGTFLVLRGNSMLSDAIRGDACRNSAACSSARNQSAADVTGLA